MSISKYTKSLPDAFWKRESGSNNKLLILLEDGLQAIYGDMTAVFESLDLDKATGETLDLYGEMLGQKRGQMTDEKYRYLIRTKIARNTASGDYNSILESLNMIFKANPGDIVIEEADEPCTVRIVKLSVATLIAAGFTSKQAIEMIETLLPACVKVSTDVVFDGTFEFSASADDYDENKGFGNDDQTIGGYFGMLFGEDGDTPLPL